MAKLSNTKHTAVVVPWRQSNRKAASEFNALPVGVALGDYGIPNIWDLDFDVVLEAVIREYRHVLNNEAISATLAAKEKAKNEGKGDHFNLVDYIHKFRMERRGQWLDGTWGTMRGTSPSVQVDELTLEMQQLMYDKIWKAAAAPIRAKCEADNTEFAPSMVPLPVKYDATFASKNSVNGHVIGAIVSSMIAADSTEKGGNIIRTLAQKNIDERARLRAEALASAESGGADDALAAMMAAPPAPAESAAAK